MPNQFVRLAPLFDALGDPTRMAVVQRLVRGPASVSALAAPFDMALPSFLQHLRVLEDAGWVRTRKEGRVRRCELDARTLRRANDWLARQHARWEKRLDQLDHYLVHMEKGTRTP